MKNKKIFIHSIWRSGSTYIWSKFKQNQNLHCYYEPLHEKLANCSKLNQFIFSQKFILKKMKHPATKGGYFSEYEIINNKIPNYKIDFSINNWFEEKTDNNNLFNYFDYLSHAAMKKNKSPLFQMCRSSGKIKWFKETFPDSYNIFILRHPRNQFSSYLDNVKSYNHYFLQINFLIFCQNNHPFINSFKKLLDIPTIPNNLTFKEKLFFAFKAIHQYSHQQHYMLFLIIWIYGFIQANQYCDLTINMDKLNTDNLYKENISNNLGKDLSLKIAFDDFNIKTYDTHPLWMNDAENIVLNYIINKSYFSKQDIEIIKNYFSYFNKLNQKLIYKNEEMKDIQQNPIYWTIKFYHDKLRRKLGYFL